MKREKNSVFASQRRLERKLKDLSMTLDEERQTHTDQSDKVLTFTPYRMSLLKFTGMKCLLCSKITLIDTLTLFCVAVCFEGEGSEEAGGRRRDRAGKDRWSEEKSSERHGGADGVQRRLADQSHCSGVGT